MDFGPGTLDGIFDPQALSLIAARASTPLAVANLASAAMIEAYRKGERRITGRFVRADTGPRTLRAGGWRVNRTDRTCRMESDFLTRGALDARRKKS